MGTRKPTKQPLPNSTLTKLPTIREYEILDKMARNGASNVYSSSDLGRQRIYSMADKGLVTRESRGRCKLTRYGRELWRRVEELGRWIDKHTNGAERA